MDRCLYHDDLVAAIEQVSTKIDAVHDDVKEIKHDLYEAGNGGMIGWMYHRKGYRKAMIFVIPMLVSAFFVTLSALVIRHFLSE